MRAEVASAARRWASGERVHDAWLQRRREEAEWSLLETAPGDHRSDFNLIDVVQHFVFGDEVIAFDD